MRLLFVFGRELRRDGPKDSGLVGREAKKGISRKVAKTDAKLAKRFMRLISESQKSSRKGREEAKFAKGFRERRESISRKVAKTDAKLAKRF